MPLLVAAPDKFRGTATAAEATGAIAAAGTARGWEVVSRPMSDGGEGFVEVLGGAVRTVTVRGPLGEPVRAHWALLEDGTAILESAQAVGRALLPHPIGEDPLKATTSGVGDLIADALAEGATAIVVGCGGTSSTDGGRGCVDALAEHGVVVDVPLVAACDVLVPFVDAATGFGPQKGATPTQVRGLVARLEHLAAEYLEQFGLDVTSVDGSGAAGGLAGGLVALGATIVSGADYVAASIGLAEVVDRADLVVTGEGRLDAGTLSGKVVRRVLDARPNLAALVVTGAADPGLDRKLAADRIGAVDVVVLSDTNQRREGTQGAIAGAVSTWLANR